MLTLKLFHKNKKNDKCIEKFFIYIISLILELSQQCLDEIKVYIFLEGTKI